MKIFATQTQTRHPDFMSLRMKYWGVRGSLPAAPLPEQWMADFEHLMRQFFRSGYKDATEIKEFLATQSLPDVGGYGTATTCVEVNSPQQQIIIDGGSGLRTLSEQMLKGPAGKGKAEIHIFLTHFHWDHLLGLPFFAPHFIKGNQIHYHAVQPNLKEMVKVKFTKPLFPVAFEHLPSNVHFHQLEPRQPLKLRDMTITPYQLDHPDPCWGYRVECGGKNYAHCVDTEGTRTTREALGPDLPLYQNADLMYFDAQYTLPELAEKANWGHSAAQLGLDIAFRENIKQILFAHHDPGANTAQINELKAQTREYYDWKIKTSGANNVKLPTVKWRYAYEGMEVDLDDV
jgi:phosphoribosyl 1,2-cyclic phosphodiesterase